MSFFFSKKFWKEKNRRNFFKYIILIFYNKTKFQNKISENWFIRRGISTKSLGDLWNCNMGIIYYIRTSVYIMNIMSWDKCLVLGKNLQKFTKFSIFSIFFSIQKLNQSGYWGDLIIFASIEKSDMAVFRLNVFGWNTSLFGKILFQRKISFKFIWTPFSKVFKK